MEPAIPQLKLVAKLPSGVDGMAWRDGVLWVAKYHGRGTYLRVHPESGSIDPIEIPAALEIAAMGGGICFAGDKLWLGDSYGDAIGSVTVNTLAFANVFRGKYFPEKSNSQSYSSLAFDGKNLWIAYHCVQYDVPPAQVQLLLYRDIKTGKVIKTLPAPPGNANDATHGLTWDGQFLWHGKGNRLCKVDPQSGEIKAEYRLPQIERVSGLAFHADRIWVLEFNGNLWELPLLVKSSSSRRLSRP